MNNIFKLFFVSFVIIAILNSCDDKQTLDPKIANQQVTKTNLIELTSEMQSTASDEDIDFFVNAITRLGSTPDSIIGKTIKQLIDEQKEFYRSELEKTLLGTGARITLFLNHKFHYRGVQFIDDDPKQLKNNIVFEITNTSDVNIKRIEGHLSFYDPQGRIVRVFPLATGVEIPPTTDDKALMFSMPFVHNPSTDDTLIRTRRDFHAVWTPTIIEFSDGKIIEDASLKDLYEVKK